MAVSERELLEALDEIISRFPNGGENRPGQREMAIEINENLRRKGCLTAEAGTGVGKSLAYLLPYILGNERVIVATYTKALQDQLIEKDLPVIADYLYRKTGRSLDYKIAKGWSNYLCKYHLNRLRSDEERNQTELDLGIAKTSIQRIIDWIDANPTKASREDMSFGVDDRTWQEVSISSVDCLKKECPFWSNCYPKDARETAKAADVIVANHSMYAYHMRHSFLGHFGRMVIDEAHQAEEAFSSALSIVLSPGRFEWLASHSKKILVFARIQSEVDIEQLERELRDAGRKLEAAFRRYEPVRIHSGEAAEITSLLSSVIPKVERLLAVVTGINQLQEDKQTDLFIKSEKRRISNAATSLLEDSVLAHQVTSGEISDKFVAFIDQTDNGKNSLTVSPLSIKEQLSEHWSARQNDGFDSEESIDKSVVMTSATIAANLSERMGLPPSRTKEVKFPSPFDFKKNALLYCPEIHSPASHPADWEEDMLKELTSLISLSDGRTLALFTSKRILDKAHRHVQKETGMRILKQGERPPKDLLREFRENEQISLFGTRMFFQGIDIPGRSLSLVVINRLPFPSPIEHLIEAWAQKQEAKDLQGFRKVLLPICKVRLHQAAGRLIRRKDDTGVVAVLDPRLADADYGRHLLEGFSQMTKTRNLDVVREFLSG